VLDILNLPATTTSLSANTDFIVRVGVPTTVNTMQLLQARRFGAPPLVVTASNSNAPIAEIDHSGGVDGVQAQTSTIAAGQFTTPNDLANGFEFDPIGVGSTTVTGSIDGFTTLPAGSRSVTVTGPAISMGNTFSVGGGLQQGPLQGTLGASQHGGVTVHLTTSDPARLKIAPNANTAGTDTLDIAVANGLTSFTYFVQAADWEPGVLAPRSSSSRGPVSGSAPSSRSVPPFFAMWVWWIFVIFAVFGDLASYGGGAYGRRPRGAY